MSRAESRAHIITPNVDYVMVSVSSEEAATVAFL